MPLYAYDCPRHGEELRVYAKDAAPCLSDPDIIAKRVWKLNIDAKSARSKGRWDPQVGAYVESDAQFRSLLREGQDREAEKLGRDVILEMVDARDTEALAELHGESVEARREVAEQTAKVKRDSGVV